MFKCKIVESVSWSFSATFCKQFSRLLSWWIVTSYRLAGRVLIGSPSIYES